MKEHELSLEGLVWDTAVAQRGSCHQADSRYRMNLEWARVGGTSINCPVQSVGPSLVGYLIIMSPGTQKPTESSQGS